MDGCLIITYEQTFVALYVGLALSHSTCSLNLPTKAAISLWVHGKNNDRYQKITDTFSDGGMYALSINAMYNMTYIF